MRDGIEEKMGKQQIEKLKNEVIHEIEAEASKPFIVSIMGQTGVGKSSLLNALFNTKLLTDPVRPCTKEIEIVITKGESGHELWFYDLPGIGESEETDNKYIVQYKQKLIESDVVIWASHIDNRSVVFDFSTLHRILDSFSEERRIQLMSKITFVLTKADLLVPPPWILVKMNDYGMFVPTQYTKDILDQKASYYQKIFLQPYGNLIISQTYNDDEFSINKYPLSYDEYNVYYQGFMDLDTLSTLKLQFPQYSSIFDRLYDNYQVIPCSSLFRFNLTKLMLVIINKLGLNAISRFNKFFREDELDMIAMSEAKRYCNLLVFDSMKEQVIFDLNQEEI